LNAPGEASIRDDPRRPLLSMMFTSLANEWVNEFDVELAQEGNHSDPLIIDLSSLPSLSASPADPNSSISFDQCLQHLRALYTTKDITDIAEIEEAIGHCQLLLVPLLYNPSPTLARAHDVLYELASLLFRAFKGTGK
jgi:hypothetical protein